MRYAATMFPPERIVCLTEETVETLYLLGEERRIVGVSGYAVRPPRVRKEKPRVAAFISADVPKIVALKPDFILVSSSSDVAEDEGRALLLHPALEKLYPSSRRIVIPEDLTVCGGPMLPDALDRLVAELKRVGG